MLSDLMTPERLENGYVIVLPGIEGKSLFNHNIVKGLLRADVPYAIEIYDWTRGFFRFPNNLRNRRRHREQAELIAGKIAAYRENHPTQPVFLIGHSGGGAMTIYTFERLPDDVRATGGVLIMPAISPDYDLTPALRQTERGLWSFSSYGDVVFLGLATLLLGTCDGKHVLGAGLTGFADADQRSGRQSGEPIPSLHEIPYRWEFAKSVNFGGHFGPSYPTFVERWIAPILVDEQPPPTASARGPYRIAESPDEVPLPVR